MAFFCILFLEDENDPRLEGDDVDAILTGTVTENGETQTIKGIKICAEITHVAFCVLVQLFFFTPNHVARIIVLNYIVLSIMVIYCCLAGCVKFFPTYSSCS